MFNSEVTTYRNLVDNLLTTKCGISINDVSVDYVDRCNKSDQSPQECFNELVDKYDLDTI